MRIDLRPPYGYFQHRVGLTGETGQVKLSPGIKSGQDISIEMPIILHLIEIDFLDKISHGNAKNSSSELLDLKYFWGDAPLPPDLQISTNTPSETPATRLLSLRPSSTVQ